MRRYGRLSDPDSLWLWTHNCSFRVLDRLNAAGISARRTPYASVFGDPYRIGGAGGARLVLVPAGWC
jgi:hypothetical protein